MSTVLATAPASVSGLVRPRLPRWAPVLAVVVAFAASALLTVAMGWGPVALVIVAAPIFLVAYPGWALVVEGRRSATDRLMTGLVWAAFLLAIAPLFSLIYTVISKGAPEIDSTFLTTSMFRTSLDQPVGIYHALIGTLLITLFAALLAVPIGIFSAIYLVEYGKGRRLARTITFLVDVMTGIPSIVAGLFAAAFFGMILGPNARMGIVAAVALSVLMIPTVVRSTEEMLKIVPNELREASFALGVRRWRTILKVVIPTAISGIASGVTLAIARVIGETAPILVTAGIASQINMNVFANWMSTLPTFIYYQILTPTSPTNIDPSVQRAWAAALLLILMVMALNLIARLVASIFAPKKGR